MSSSSHDLVAVIRPLISKAARPCPELSAGVAATKNDVCRRHVAELRREIPTGATLSDEGALDDLDVVIGALVPLFLDPQSVEKISRLGPAHAAAREGQQFTLSEVFGEYVLFRRNLREHLEAYLGRAFSPVEHETFQSGVDAVVTAMVVSFTRQRDARLELEANAQRDYLSSLSHDIRNEINSVLISMRVMQLSHEDWKRAAQQANSAPILPSHLENLLRDIESCRGAMESTMAAMSRVLEADRLAHVTLELRETDLRPLMNGIARSADRLERAQAGRKASTDASRIHVECPDHPVVRTDPDLLSAILSNLLANAVKYTTGPIIFRAELTPQLGRISVIDSGPGLSAEQKKNIFNKFNRGGRSTGEGMGLGLFIAQKAARLLNARLQVESQPGQGSHFWIEWPRLESTSPRSGTA